MHISTNNFETDKVLSPTVSTTKLAIYNMISYHSKYDIKNLSNIKKKNIIKLTIPIINLVTLFQILFIGVKVQFLVNIKI